MISPLAAALYCVAALGLALGLFTQLSFRAARESPFRFLSAFVYALALDSLGTAVLTDAPDLLIGHRGQTLQLLGQAFALAAFCDFQQRATRDDSRAVVLWMRSVCAVLVLLAGTGLLLDPTRPSPQAALSLPGAIVYPEVSLSAIGHVAYVVAMLMVARGVFKLRSSRREEVAAPMFYSFVLASVAVLHDQLIRFGLIESIYTLEFASIVCMLTVSTLRARRIVQDGRDLERRSEELERSHVQLGEARDALVQARRLATIGELSAVIAHEVRNPLAVIKNAASSLRRRDALAPEMRERLLLISREEVQRLAQLVDDMLTYAKPLRPELESHRPLELLRAAIERARAEPGVPGDVPIEIDPGSEAAAEVRADARLVIRALANVLSNALRASPTGDTVQVAARDLPRISAAKHGPAVEFVVRDRGLGMDSETRRKARDPFFTTRPKGTGLGLAIADRVVQAHHGRLEISDTAGTEVRIAIPLEPPRASVPPPDPQLSTPPAPALPLDP